MGSISGCGRSHVPFGMAKKKKKERGSSDTCHPPRHLFSLSLSLPILFISFPTKCSHPPRTYPTPHFSKHKPNPFPPPWIIRTKNTLCRIHSTNIGKYLIFRATTIVRMWGRGLENLGDLCGQSPCSAILGAFREAVDGFCSFLGSFVVSAENSEIGSP